MFDQISGSLSHRRSESSQSFRSVSAFTDAGRLRRWQGSALDKQGTTAASTKAPRPDFAPYIVGGIIDPPCTILGPRLEPPWPDDHQDDSGQAERVTNTLFEVLASLDRVDVAEHLIGAEMLREAIEQAPGRADAVGAPVAQEDRKHAVIVRARPAQEFRIAEI